MEEKDPEVKMSTSKTPIRDEINKLKEERDKIDRQIEAWEDLLALEARLAEEKKKKD